jgi:hypothetical protein
VLEAKRVAQFVRQCPAASPLGRKFIAEATLGQNHSIQFREEDAPSNLPEITDE